MKMGLGPNLTLQATVNPDFGQVEADPAEVNLTAIPTRFTEKRPLFTEDSQLLDLTRSFFYSHRIGAKPSGKASGDFVDYPSATTILGAAKLTGRIRPRTSLGILVAVTNEESARLFNVAVAGYHGSFGSRRELVTGSRGFSRSSGNWGPRPAS